MVSVKSVNIKKKFSQTLKFCFQMEIIVPLFSNRIHKLKG